MKKSISLFLILIAIAVFCSAKRWNPKLVEEFHDVSGTPEDSVIFYGAFNSMDSKATISFTQTNSDFAPDKQTMTGDYFISKPVRPGSRYILQHLEGVENMTSYVGNGGAPGFKRRVTSYSYKEHFSQKDTPLTIEIPNKPGIYYFGYYRARATAEYKDLVEMYPVLIGPKTPAEWEADVLKNAITLYKDTEWEIKLQERLNTLLEEKE